MVMQLSRLDDALILLFAYLHKTTQLLDYKVQL